MATLEHSGRNPKKAVFVPIPAAAAASRARVRGVVVYGLGTALLILNAYFGTYAYVVAQALLWTQTSLLRGPVVMLFVLVALNLLFLKLARLLGRREAAAGEGVTLSQQELVLLYAMLGMGTCSAGYGFVQILINQVASPFYADFATSSSKFKDIVWPNVPAWLAPRGADVLNAFYRGNGSLYNPVVLHGWAIPVLAWSAFIFGVFFTLLCATSLMRRSWVEEERLTFPLVLLPLEMTERGGNNPFWTNPLMWTGFVVAGVLESFNFINFLYPAFPTIPLKPSMGANNIAAFLTVRPWNAIGHLWIAFYPFAIGIAYLLALDVSFSCWFLYLVGKAALLFCSVAGLSEGGSGPANRAPFLREQGLGAFVGVALFTAWTARRTLARAWEEVWRPTGWDRDELMSSRMAVLGGLIGLLFLTVFLTLIGLSPGMAALFVFIYVCFSLTLARIISEAGAGWAWAPDWSATGFVGDSFGESHLSARQVVALHGYTSWTNDMRDNPMAHQMEAMKMGQGSEIRPRTFLAPLLWACLFGILCAFWAHLDIYYRFGAATAKVRPALANGATGPFRTAVSMITTPTRQDIPGMTAAFVGMLIAIGLSVARQQFPWWPFHPLGYALAMTQSMDYMWFPFFLAWLAKRTTLRYGGIKAYRAALPFFLGLILGDYVVPAIWGLFGLTTNTQQYMSFPH